jgi:hypothetical protein
MIWVKYRRKWWLLKDLAVEWDLTRAALYGRLKAGTVKLPYKKVRTQK